MKVEFAQSARKHRVGRARALHVIANPVVEITMDLRPKWRPAVRGGQCDESP